MVHMFDPIFHFQHGLTRSICFVATTASCDFQRRYLKELAKSKRPLPRRQEADMERFRVAGEEVTALVSHEEIESWAKGSQNAIICSISHAWETREHPDPCRYQLELINSHASLFDLAFVADIWIFYDYVSLYQFERETDAQRENFGKAMGNMHVMYAHESTLTFRIESLTPDDVWEVMKPKNLVPVWHVESRKVVPRGLKDLVENRTPYTDRGWCKAEIEWSSARSENAQNQQIDLLDKVIDDESELSSAESEEAELKCRVVRTPEQFRINMETSKFTHRSDAECVVDLQEKIFFEKVTACEDLVLKGLPVSEIIELAFALPHYKNLKSIRMENFRCGPEEAKALGQAGGLSVGWFSSFSWRLFLFGCFEHWQLHACTGPSRKWNWEAWATCWRCRNWLLDGRGCVCMFFRHAHLKFVLPCGFEWCPSRMKVCGCWSHASPARQLEKLWRSTWPWHMSTSPTTWLGQRDWRPDRKTEIWFCAGTCFLQKCFRRRWKFSRALDLVVRFVRFRPLAPHFCWVKHSPVAEQALVEALKINKAVTHINLSNNNLGPEVAKASRSPLPWRLVCHVFSFVLCFVWEEAKVQNFALPTSGAFATSKDFRGSIVDPQPAKGRRSSGCTRDWP